MPGPSYTREFGYNEESQLLSISHSGTVDFQYAYGADGNRRWAKDIANNKWTWYPCGVACGAGELVEQGSDLTGGTWTTNAQYLRAGGGCRSMLIRQKITNLNDEYHHIDPVGMFGVLTDASGNVLRNYVYDAFSDAPYKRQYVGESFPSQSNHTGSCQLALSEPGILSGSGGRGVVVPSRGFQVMGNRPVPVKKHPCKPAHHSVHHGLPWHSIIACLVAGVIDELAGCIRNILANASTACLACLGAALIGCIAAPEACAGDIGAFIDLCELDACDSGLLSCLTSDLPKNIVKFVGCVGVLHSL